MKHFLTAMVLNGLLVGRGGDATVYEQVTPRKGKFGSLSVSALKRGDIKIHNKEYPNCPFGAMRAPTNAPYLCNPQLAQTTPQRPYNPDAWRNRLEPLENPLFPFCPPNYACRPTSIPENNFIPFFICCLEEPLINYLQCPFPEVKVPFNPMIFGPQRPTICETKELDLSSLRWAPPGTGFRHWLRISYPCPFGSVCRPALNAIMPDVPAFVQEGQTDAAICCRPVFK